MCTAANSYVRSPLGFGQPETGGRRRPQSRRRPQRKKKKRDPLGCLPEGGRGGDAQLTDFSNGAPPPVNGGSSSSPTLPKCAPREEASTNFRLQNRTAGCVTHPIRLADTD
ncbi:hypothetical protein HPB50_025235 [Hyalomma asiaticum]|uniref:Uncharacterized protein n=1 Tax=Hyalomma asiaticum TaxID=266040 RepID=A0ACB7SAG6_HYAAI|nr:hypothetical protein HPB50_025235 [Hyalomma asiaticum]